jgi:predicted TIM-barrel fold metal-dependent hydrolase
MRIIDSHVHLYPAELNRDPAGWAAANREPHWAELCTRRRSDGRCVQTFPSVDDLLREMDRAGVERAVLLGWYWEQPATCSWQNRFFAECVSAHPQRLAAYGTIHPRLGLWPTLDEMHRIRDGGLTGVGELSPNSQGYSVDDSVFREVLTLAGDWKMPVNLHVTDPEGRDYPGRVATPLADFARLARECPKTRFVLAHWGGLLPLRDESVRELPNVFYDTAASPLLYDEGIWQRFRAVVSDERVLFGSDYPLNLFPKLDAAPDMTRFIAQARAAGAGEAVMCGNVSRLLDR